MFKACSTKGRLYSGEVETSAHYRENAERSRVKWEMMKRERISDFLLLYKCALINLMITNLIVIRGKTNFSNISYLKQNMSHII